MGRWSNKGRCKALDNVRSCGPGVQRQTRSCTNGTYEKCSLNDVERFLDCRFPDCSKSLGDWMNQGDCQGLGRNSSCGDGFDFRI